MLILPKLSKGRLKTSPLEQTGGVEAGPGWGRSKIKAGKGEG